MLIKQRTQLMNSLRAMLAEFGVVAAQGYRGFAELRAHLASPENELPETLVAALGLLSKQFDALTPAIEKLEDRSGKSPKPIRTCAGSAPFRAWASSPPMRSWRRSGMGASSPAERTWAGMTPRQHSSAGKRRAPGLSRQGEGRLRKLFALGATTLMRNARLRQDRATVWQRGLMARRPMKVAIIAQAAKTAENRLGGPFLRKALHAPPPRFGESPPLGHAHGMSSSMRDAGQRLTSLSRTSAM